MKRIIFAIFLLSLIISSYSAAQRTTKGLDIKIGIQPPVFNFNDLYNTGFGFYFGGLFPFKDDLQFTLYTGYLSWGFDNEAFNRRYTNQYYTSFDLEAPISLIPLTLGIKYYASNTKVRPYLTADFGFFYYWQNATGSYYWKNPANGQESLYTLSNQNESGIRTMLGLGAGMTMPISKIIDFDLQAKFNALYNAQAINGTNNSGQISGSSSTLYYLSFMAGINYYFSE